ncbi:MAG: DctP family TRAP transporter solute-binding subunit [Azospirillum sp.]|nr:DctP family TRAP transporter solute-binding subunit [Azospirillum sp.]
MGKPWRTVTAVAMLAVAWTGGATGGATAETVFKLGYSLGPKAHYGIGAQAFGDEVARQSNGRYRIEMFPNNALGGEREMIEGAQLGTVDLVISSTGPVGNFVPSTLITDIPFLFRDYAHARAVLDGPIGQEILDEFPAHGLIGLAWCENGFRHLTNSVRAVHEPEDIKGLKLRTMQNDVHMEAFSTLGALPTPMAFPELFTSLQQHTVDGQENPIPVIVSAKFAQVQKYLSLTGHVYSPALFIMSPYPWEAMPTADRAIFLAAAKVGAQAMRAEVNRVEDSGIAQLRAAGMTVDTEVDKAAFQKVLAPAYTDYAKRFGQADIDRIRNYRP